MPGHQIIESDVCEEARRRLILVALRMSRISQEAPIPLEDGDCVDALQMVQTGVQRARLEEHPPGIFAHDTSYGRCTPHTGSQRGGRYDVSCSR
jgi:hypothetical protein